MSRKTDGGLTIEAPDVAQDSTDPPYLWGLLAGGAVFLLYIVTLSPTTAFWDTSEYIATAHTLGVPHQPGNPLFVVLARAWEILLAPLGLSVAVRINLFSAFVSAAAHGLWFLVVHHILGHFRKDRRFRIAGALVAVVISATAFTVWSQSNVNEKVYTVALLTIALLTWLAFRWQARIGNGKDDNGNHLMAFLVAPAIAVFVLAVRPRTILNWNLYPAVLAVAVAGLSVQPVSADASHARSVTYGKVGCVALGESLTRAQFGDRSMLALPWDLNLPRTPGLFLSQLLHYFQYFDWQWSRGVQGTHVLLAGFRLPFTLLFMTLGVWGAVEHRRRDRESFLYMLVLFGTLSLGLVVYLNFKYGYSIGPDLGNLDFHEVRERDYFFIASFSVWGLWAGIGLVAIWDWLARNSGTRPIGPELELGIEGGRLHRAGLGLQPPDERRAIRGAFHHGRQRRFPALVHARG